jgi:hypothetical protein
LRAYSAKGGRSDEPHGGHSGKAKTMLWTILVVLGILWLLGFSFHVGGGLIHLLLVVGLVILVLNALSGRRLA